MKKNVHIYFSEMKHESRMFKMVNSLEAHEVFDKIFMIGCAAVDCSAKEHFSERTQILRVDSLLVSLKDKTSILRNLSWYLNATLTVLWIRPTCLNIHHVNLIPLAILVKILSPKTLLVYDTHELETETNGISNMKKRLRRVLEFIGKRWFDHTVTVSPPIAQWYENKLGLRSVSLVMNCPPFTPPQKSDYLRSHFGIADDKKIFLYQGIINADRGIEKLFGAINQLPDTAVLVLLGYGRDYEKWRIFAETSDRIFVHPGVPFDTMLRVTASADCGISFVEDTCLNHRFALPNKLFEFIQARIPVIVSPTMAQANVVTEEGVGLVCKSFDSDALVSACQTFLDGALGDPADNLNMAAEKYCWNTQEKALLDVYRDLRLI